MNQYRSHKTSPRSVSSQWPEGWERSRKLFFRERNGLNVWLGSEGLELYKLYQKINYRRLDARAEGKQGRARRVGKLAAARGRFYLFLLIYVILPSHFTPFQAPIVVYPSTLF